MARGAKPTLHPSARAIARSFDRDRDRTPIERGRSIVETWRCRCCHNEWTLEGSYALGFCTRCTTPRPPGA